MKKFTICLTSAVGVIAVLGFLLYFSGALFIGGFFSPPVNYDRMEKIFRKDREYIFTAWKYLADSEYDDIYIPSDMEKQKMSVSGEVAEINGKQAAEAIDTLKKRGYSVIGKENSTIYFQRWSNLDSGRGIAYSADNTPSLQFLTELQPLSEANWYYYEEDFNEWRIRTENLQK